MNICRLCLSKEAIFPLVGSSALKVIACTSLEIEHDDGLPQNICPACRLHLEEIHCFRRRCQEADRCLRRHIALEREGIQPKLNEIQEGFLRDVAGCTPTACSESNSQWRQQAAQLIRTELSDYKKELLNTCKQTVRADIELELRAELEEVILAEARKELRLNVLDDVFHELEQYFERKRNETAYDLNGSERINSNSEIQNNLNNQIVAEHSEGFYEAETSDEQQLTTNDDCVVELLDDEPESSTQLGATPMVAVPMVEINMHDSQLTHLREDFKKESFLSFKNSPMKVVKTKNSRIESPRKNIDKFCWKHSSRAKRSSKATVDTADCVRCSFRGTQNNTIKTRSISK
ncbi:uncharacterized protein LOC108115639 [Drosophila eugracilis]|uniref:uncharacterized protein LOC108115639 n=1 Tax=Drosophila eugracilis TaxID=29029 RepID=UPI001BDA6C1E|nr:uncharacterized protein LOC108115639 [Drosophila eugracilis]